MIEMAGPWITDLEEKIVLDAVKNGWYEPDKYKYVELFEAEFARYHNRKYGLMTTNCTAAIHLALAARGIKQFDEVIAPDCTWVGSTAGITYVGAWPVFADIDARTWCLNTETIDKCITKRTKAIIVVDLYGNMPNWNEIYRDWGDYFIIEDAAEALGSCYRSQRAGSFGNCSVFSFHRTKTITTGEGGMLLTDDEKLYQRCKTLRDHGRKSGSYYVEEVAYKYMPFNLQAALGYAQFQRIDDLVARKRAILHGYKKRLESVEGLQFNDEGGPVYNGAWNTVMVSDSKYAIDIMEGLERLNIPSRPFFHPLSSLPAYGDRTQAYKNITAWSIYNRGVCLPSALNLTEDDLDRVCEAILQVLA